MSTALPTIPPDNPKRNLTLAQPFPPPDYSEAALPLPFRILAFTGTQPVAAKPCDPIGRQFETTARVTCSIRIRSRLRRSRR